MREQMKLSNQRIQELTERGLESPTIEERQKNLEFVIDVGKLGAQMYPLGRAVIMPVDVATIGYELKFGDTMKGVSTAVGVAGEALATMTLRGGSAALEIRERGAAVYGFILGKLFEQTVVPNPTRPQLRYPH
jgi:hypothetical protein